MSHYQKNAVIINQEGNLRPSVSVEVQEGVQLFPFFAKQERLGSILAPYEKTACIQDLYVNEFLWRFFRKEV